MSAPGAPSLEEMLDSWPSQAEEAARKTIGRCGPPDEVTPTSLHKEEMNFLALNLMHDILMHDIVTGKLGVDEARRHLYGDGRQIHDGPHEPYTQGLQFEASTTETTDPDVTTMAETLLHKRERS